MRQTKDVVEYLLSTAAVFAYAADDKVQIVQFVRVRLCYEDNHKTEARRRDIAEEMHTLTSAEALTETENEHTSENAYI